MADVIKGECKKGKIGIEKSAVISGRVETLVGHKAIKEGIVNLISPDKGFYAVTKTDAQGRFSFEGIDFLKVHSMFLMPLQKLEIVGKTAIR